MAYKGEIQYKTGQISLLSSTDIKVNDCIVDSTGNIYQIILVGVNNNTFQVGDALYSIKGPTGDSSTGGGESNYTHYKMSISGSVLYIEEE